MPDSNALPGEPDTLMTAPRKVLVIFNPTAGARRRARLTRILEIMWSLGAAVTLHETKARGDAERTAREASTKVYDVVVAAGGDGTINEVINGLSGRQIPLGIIPLGTANVLAAELDLPTDDVGLARTIALGRTRPVTLGDVNGRRFVMMAGVGFDAHVVASVDAGLKRLIGKSAYVWETLRGFFRYKFRSYRLIVDGKPYEVGSAVFANGHFYGVECLALHRLDDPGPARQAARLRGRACDLHHRRGPGRRARAGRRRHHHPPAPGCPHRERPPEHAGSGIRAFPTLPFVALAFPS